MRRGGGGEGRGGERGEHHLLFHKSSQGQVTRIEWDEVVSKIHKRNRGVTELKFGYKMNGEKF